MSENMVSGGAERFYAVTPRGRLVCNSHFWLAPGERAAIHEIQQEIVSIRIDEGVETNDVLREWEVDDRFTINITFAPLAPASRYHSWTFSVEVTEVPDFNALPPGSYKMHCWVKANRLHNDFGPDIVEIHAQLYMRKISIAEKIELGENL